ncbi:MAG: branched-chain amino acid ABC transporter permease [Proteobacteria bacterium]|nr:branched-chain amino acid ABC transporter permease [Pseudomonadota bacterium]
MAALDRRHVFVVTLLALFALLPIAAQLADQPFYIGQFRRILIFAIAAISLDLILGYGGMVSLGHAAFFGIGAYVVGILNHHAAEETLFLGLLPGSRNVLITWPLAMLVAAASAGLIGLVSLRTSGIYFIMITLAFAQMVYFFFVSLSAYGGDDGLRFPGDTVIAGLIDTQDDIAFYYAVFAVLAGVLYLCQRMIESRFGLVIQGCRENERRMQAIGFPTFRYRLACFTIAGGIAGLAGALFAAHESYISPSIMHWTRSGDLIVMVVMGGMGSLIGPVVGATVFLLMEKLLPDYTEHWPVVFGPVLLLIVLFAKRGIFGWLRPREHRRAAP